MKEFGINVAEGDVASTPDEAEKIARYLSTQDIVIKAQVHSGGRNKGVFDNGFKSGIHVCSSPEEAKGYALKMLHHRLRTPQSGPEGKLCSKLFIGKRVYVRKETYFALALDRSAAGPVMIGSPFGGVDIEQVARERPEAIIKIPVSYIHGPTDEQALQMAQALGFRSQICIKAAQQIKKLYHLFSTYDATLVEVNPFVETSESEVLCLDAKLNFDDNALFRQPKLVELADPSQADERELEAAKHELNFISLDGNIGCLVNGAGLAMATMDMIKLHGGEPANFLDVGGGATAKQVTEALKIISTDINVRAVLINIFGGIMKCDIIALGILNAVKVLNLRLPLVLRLQGTNVQEAKKLIEASGLRVIAADDLDEAAQKAVKVSQIVEMARNVRLDVFRIASLSSLFLK